MHKVIATVAVSLGAAALLTGPVIASDGGSGNPPGGSGAHVQAQEVKPAQPPAPKFHEVQGGDSLSSIAGEEKLDSWRPLWDANADLQNPDLIYAGQKLVVPDGPTAERPLPVQSVSAPVRTYSAPMQTVRQHAVTANYAAGAGGLLARVRQRESGGNYATNTGNGYYGAYQFTVGTWQGVGGSGLPSSASPAEQDMRAQMLLNQRGCSPWPNTCF